MKKKLAVMMALVLGAALTACSGSVSTGEEAAKETEALESTMSAMEAEVDSTAESVMAEIDSAVDEVIDESLVMTYDEYVAAEVDDPVVVSTYVQAKQGWWEDKATLYTQSPEGAYFIYEMPISEEDYEALVPGTKILVSGFKAEWSGEIEIVDATYEVVEGGDTFIAEPKDITEMLGSDDLVNYQNQYISVKDMKVVATKDADGNDAAYVYNWDGSGTDGDDLYFNVSKGGADDPVYTFTVESYLTGPGTDVYEAVKGLEIGQTIDMEGYLYWYEGANPHIVSVTVK